MKMKPGETGRTNQLEQREFIARQGLRFPAITLKHLRCVGIYCQPTVSIEHQHLAKKYVLRGVESGGATAEIGAYSSFVDEHGKALPWLQRVDTVGVNGVHAIVVSPVLVRLQMLRIERTYDLLITRHSLATSANQQRPRLESSILFFGRRGCLEMELWGKDSSFRGTVSPIFFSRGGEPTALPDEFQDAGVRVAAAVCCVGCRHCHLLEPKSVVEVAVAATLGNESNLSTAGKAS
ncbi:MAG: hypothetical protein ACRD2U_04390 [Terriglobales bacterium]